MIGRQEGLLCYLLIDSLPLVRDDVVVFLSDQSEARFPRTMRSEANKLRVVFTTFAFATNFYPLADLVYSFLHFVIKQANDSPMDFEVQVAVNFLIGYLVNKLPRRRVQLFGEEVVKRLTKKFEGHWYPEKPCKGSGYRCLLITDSLDPVLSSAANESGLSLKDVKANLPEKLCLWIDPQEVSFRIGEQGAVKTIYKAEKKSEEICDETARWVNLLNGHNNGMPSSISPVPFRSQSPPRVMAGRSSPVFSSSSSSSTSPPSYNPPFTYSSWSSADESSLYKFRAKRASPTLLSANAKEFNYRVPKESFSYGVPQGRSGLDSTRGAFLSNSVLDWFNYNEFGNFNAAAQLPILA